jgi:hypothetical protein
MRCAGAEANGDKIELEFRLTLACAGSAVRIVTQNIIRSAPPPGDAGEAGPLGWRLTAAEVSAMPDRSAMTVSEYADAYVWSPQGQPWEAGRHHHGAHESKVAAWAIDPRVTRATILK